MTGLYDLGVAQTFYFNLNWCFGHQGSIPKAFTSYLVIYGFGFLLNIFALCLFVNRLGFRHQIVQGTMIIVLAIILFSLQKFPVFRKI